MILEPLERALARGAPHLRRGRRLRPQRRRVPHHRAVARWRGAAACMQLALDDAGLDVRRDRSRERARHVDPAQRRRRGRGDPQGVRRRRAAGHVDQGRHRPHDRRPRARPRRSSRCSRSATASSRRPPTSRQIGDDIALDVVHGEPRSDRARARAVELVRVRRPQRHADPRASGSEPRRVTELGTPTPVFGHRSDAVAAALREIDGRTGQLVQPRRRQAPRRDRHARRPDRRAAVRLAIELGIPVVGRDRELGRRRRRGRRVAARVGTGGAGAGRRVGRRPDRAPARRTRGLGTGAAARASSTTWS